MSCRVVLVHVPSGISRCVVIVFRRRVFISPTCRCRSIARTCRSKFRLLLLNFKLRPLVLLLDDAEDRREVQKSVHRPQTRAAQARRTSISCTASRRVFVVPTAHPDRVAAPIARRLPRRTSGRTLWEEESSGPWCRSSRSSPLRHSLLSPWSVVLGVHRTNDAPPFAMAMRMDCCSCRHHERAAAQPITHDLHHRTVNQGNMQVENAVFPQNSISRKENAIVEQVVRNKMMVLRPILATLRPQNPLVESQNPSVESHFENVEPDIQTNF